MLISTACAHCGKWENLAHLSFVHLNFSNAPISSTLSQLLPQFSFFLLHFLLLMPLVCHYRQSYCCWLVHCFYLLFAAVIIFVAGVIIAHCCCCHIPLCWFLNFVWPFHALTAIVVSITTIICGAFMLYYLNRFVTKYNCLTARILVTYF